MLMSESLTDDGNGGFVSACQNGQLRISFPADNIIHYCLTATGAARESAWGLCPAPDGATPVLASRDGRELTASRIGVQLGDTPGRVTFRTGDGRVLLDLVSAALEPATVSGESTFHPQAAFAAPAGEAYYGLGQHQAHWMDHRGQDVRLWHDYASEGGETIGVPFLVTNRGYGVVWNNPSRTTLRPGIDGLTRWQSEVGEAVSFFVIAGATTDEIYAGYRALTGVTPLPPRGALGYIQCKQRYASQAELLTVARTLRAKRIPCDVLIVDWFHWKTLGDLDLDPEPWPDPAAMNRELQALGFRVMISCWPRFMKESRHYAELERRGWFMKQADGTTLYGTPEDPRGAVIDTTNADCRRWYWDTIRASYAARGFTAWWLDENEPDICPHPYFLDAGTGARVHNLYPLTHTQAVYEGHRRDLPERCLILSRSAYLGAQQHGTTFWSSDIFPVWDALQRQVPAGLNFCASGFAWWSSDIGGWQAFDWKRPAWVKADPEFDPLIKAPDSIEWLRAHPGYVELYVRWFQYAAFCPTFRAHGSRPENEVWSLGEEAERILTNYVTLRYRLMPYLYSLAWRTHTTGAPFMRALFMDFPDDPKVRDLKDEYMFGPAFLVAPVIQPGQGTRDVYLPAGAEWYDYWTGRRHAGGQTLTVEAPIDTLPLFVRAGSIIPMGNGIEHTGEAQDRIEIHVYPGHDAAFELYRDDGRTYRYEQGEHTLTRLRWDDARRELHVDADPEGLFRRPREEWLTVM
jgi:alpha-D-xyloside xylohydrolase